MFTRPVVGSREQTPTGAILDTLTESARQDYVETAANVVNTMMRLRNQERANADSNLIEDVAVVMGGFAQELLLEFGLFADDWRSMMHVEVKR
jgi:hypothetical protein